MCGVNKGQFRLSIGHVGDTIGLAQQWLEQLHHIADEGGMATESKELAQVAVALGDIRARLDGVADDASTGSEHFTVEPV